MNSQHTARNHLQVFLCHSSADKEKVRQLYFQLKLGGISVWFDEESLLPGQIWEEEIKIAIQNSDIVLVCLSNNSLNNKGYVHKEISIALDIALYQPEGAIYIIPALLESGCKVPEHLNKYQWAKLYEEKGFEKLGYTLINVAEQLNRSIPQIHSPTSSESQKRLEKLILERIHWLELSCLAEPDSVVHRQNLGLLYFLLGSLWDARKLFSEARIISSGIDDLSKGWIILISLTIGDVNTTKRILHEVQTNNEFNFPYRDYYFLLYKSWIDYLEGNIHAWDYLINECLNKTPSFGAYVFFYFEFALGLASSGLVAEAWKAIEIGKFHELGILYMCGMAYLPPFSKVFEDQKYGPDFESWFNFYAKAFNLPNLKEIKKIKYDRTALLKNSYPT